jgi:hypothetical protein
LMQKVRDATDEDAKRAASEELMRVIGQSLDNYLHV